MRKPLSVSAVNYPQALIALGANLPSEAGTPQNTLTAALIQLSCQSDVTINAVSRFFVTAAFPPGSGPDYINSAAILGTTLDPQAVLALLHEIEARFGRQRETRWGARGIDLDLIAMGDAVLPDAAGQTAWRELPLTEQTARAPEELILPHPRLQDRAFVLGPLAEIAPGWRHPLTGQTVAAMLAALPAEARADLRPLGDPPRAPAEGA